MHKKHEAVLCLGEGALKSNRGELKRNLAYTDKYAGKRSFYVIKIMQKRGWTCLGKPYIYFHKLCDLKKLTRTVKEVQCFWCDLPKLYVKSTGTDSFVFACKFRKKVILELGQYFCHYMKYIK